jgi:Origin of replication binding protein
MKNKYRSVLIITPRIAYAEHVVKEFGVQSYLTGKFDENCLACSVESFHRIPDTHYYDCVILDECEAILSIFSSPTLKNRELETYQKLKKIIEKSQKVFFAGAFITQKTIDFIQSFNMTSLICGGILCRGLALGWATLIDLWGLSHVRVRTSQILSASQILSGMFSR